LTEEINGKNEAAIRVATNLKRGKHKQLYMPLKLFDLTHPEFRVMNHNEWVLYIISSDLKAKSYNCEFLSYMLYKNGNCTNPNPC
jgi:hypothetical protein